MNQFKTPIIIYYFLIIIHKFITIKFSTFKQILFNLYKLMLNYAIEVYFK